MDKWRYFKDNVGLHRFKIVWDDDPLNPRESNDALLGTLNLWWNRCSFGDNEGKGDPSDMLEELVREHVPEDVLIKKALDGELVTPQYEKDGDEYIALTSNGTTYHVPESEFVDEIISEISVNQMMMLLSYYIVILPCFIYEHSGFTISCDNTTYPYNDRWDSGKAGFIYTTKERCEYQWGMKDLDASWKKRAIEELNDEIHVYDMYLRNECYGYKEELYKEDIDEWDELNSVWGFYVDLCGDEFVEFFKGEMTSADTPLISEEDAMEMARQMHEEYMTMDQANTMVAI